MFKPYKMGILSGSFFCSFCKRLLGLENVHEALEGLCRKKGKVLEFDRQHSGDKFVVLKEKAVREAVN